MTKQKYDEQLELARRGYDLSEREWVDVELPREVLESAAAVCEARGITISEFIGDLLDHDMAQG
jgi:hypothetical protein